MFDTTIEIALTIFMLLMLIAQLIAIRFRVPYTLVLVFIGIGAAGLSAAAFITNPIASELLTSIAWIKTLYGQLVSSGLFVGLIVPPLIFEAMMHIKRTELGKVIRPALALATVGVVLSTLVAGFVVWELAGVPLLIALIFAAIIAPTDTITVLQVFRHARVPKRLSAMMDLEAAFNDATAIILFSIVLSSIGLQNDYVIGGFATFLYSFFGGAFVGLAVGRAARWMHRRIDDKLVEIILTIAVVYGSYVLAEALGASGLIAVAITGLYFGNTTMKVAMTKGVRQAVVSFWEIAAFIGNAVAFLYIGFVANIAIFLSAAGLILIAYASTIIARIAAVYPIFAVSNHMARKIPGRWGNVAVLGGVRGAISIALVASLASSSVVSSSNLATITTMVLGVVFISLIVQVPLLSRYIAKLFGRYKTLHDVQ